jgi:hypothetical protein
MPKRGGVSQAKSGRSCGLIAFAVKNCDDLSRQLKLQMAVILRSKSLFQNLTAHHIIDSIVITILRKPTGIVRM